MPGNITKRLIIGMFLTLVAALVYVLMSAANGPAEQRPFERFGKGALAGLDFAYSGERPSDTDFAGPEGQSQTLADLKGKIILVNFWATWCPPCREEMPSLGALQTAFDRSEFEVIAVSVDNDEDTERAAAELANWTGGALDFYHTSEFALTYSVGVSGFPTSILYDAEGREIARYAGELDWASLEAVGFIRAVIDQS